MSAFGWHRHDPDEVENFDVWGPYGIGLGSVSLEAPRERLKGKRSDETL